jgi:hypothetical protein
MAIKLNPSLRSSLERLKHSGLVNGIALAWRRQPLCLLMPYEIFRSEKMVNYLYDARDHFAEGGHVVDTLWFGYADVHVLGVFQQDTLLIILHSRAVEVDFLTRAANTCLADTQLLIESSLRMRRMDALAPLPLELGNMFPGIPL